MTICWPDLSLQLLKKKTFSFGIRPQIRIYPILRYHTLGKSKKFTALLPAGSLALQSEDVLLCPLYLFIVLVRYRIPFLLASPAKNNIKGIK